MRLPPSVSTTASGDAPIVHLIVGNQVFSLTQNAVYRFASWRFGQAVHALLCQQPSQILSSSSSSGAAGLFQDFPFVRSVDVWTPNSLPSVSLQREPGIYAVIADYLLHGAFFLPLYTSANSVFEELKALGAPQDVLHSFLASTAKRSETGEGSKSGPSASGTAGSSDEKKEVSTSPNSGAADNICDGNTLPSMQDKNNDSKKRKKKRRRRNKRKSQDKENSPESAKSDLWPESLQSQQHQQVRKRSRPNSSSSASSSGSHSHSRSSGSSGSQDSLGIGSPHASRQSSSNDELNSNSNSNSLGDPNTNTGACSNSNSNSNSHGHGSHSHASHSHSNSNSFPDMLASSVTNVSGANQDDVRSPPSGCDKSSRSSQDLGGAAVSGGATTSPTSNLPALTSAPKKPLNAFNFFASEQRSFLRAQMSPTDLKQTNRRIGDLWRELAPDQKEVYRQRAHELNRRYAEQHGQSNVAKNEPQMDSVRIKTVKPNGYNEYLYVRTPQVRREHPEMDFRDITKLLSEEWRSLSSDVKQLYRDESLHKAQHRKVKRIQTAAKKSRTDGAPQHHGPGQPQDLGTSYPQQSQSSQLPHSHAYTMMQSMRAHVPLQQSMGDGGHGNFSGYGGMTPGATGFYNFLNVGDYPSMVPVTQMNVPTGPVRHDGMHIVAGANGMGVPDGMSETELSQYQLPMNGQFAHTVSAPPFLWQGQNQVDMYAKGALAPVAMVPSTVDAPLLNSTVGYAPHVHSGSSSTTSSLLHASAWPMYMQQYPFSQQSPQPQPMQMSTTSQYVPQQYQQVHHHQPQQHVVSSTLQYSVKQDGGQFSRVQSPIVYSMGTEMDGLAYLDLPDNNLGHNERRR